MSFTRGQGWGNCAFLMSGCQHSPSCFLCSFVCVYLSSLQPLWKVLVLHPPQIPWSKTPLQSKSKFRWFSSWNREIQANSPRNHLVYKSLLWKAASTWSTQEFFSPFVSCVIDAMKEFTGDDTLCALVYAKRVGGLVDNITPYFLPKWMLLWSCYSCTCCQKLICTFLKVWSGWLGTLPSQKFISQACFSENVPLVDPL